MNPASAAQAADAAPSLVDQALDVFNGYLTVFVAAFLVTVCVTPIMRRLAINAGVIDRPDQARKSHKIPIAYLGGVAVFLGLLAGIAVSFLGVGGVLGEALYDEHLTRFEQRFVPLSIIFGLALITITGLVDDVVGLDPRLKIVGQLLAAAALAMDDVGVKVAEGVMAPIGRLVGNEELLFLIPLPAELPMVGSSIQLDLIYWTGTAIIAVFVLGGCNASNLIDGLDGLLSGVTAVAAAGILLIALTLAVTDDGRLDEARVVLALALLGATLGFLPHNFNPASIFLGDCGSLLLGYTTIVLILSLGDTGKTHLVIAGLIIYAIPIIDTALAIVRRKLAGKRMSDPDDQHLHHMLKRALGVKGAVLTLYLIGAVFAALGVWITAGRVRIVFTVALVIGAFVGVTAIKVARRQALEAQTTGFADPADLTGRPGHLPDRTDTTSADADLSPADAVPADPAAPAPPPKPAPV